ncbi:hypothetical protein SVAN01_04955 [Stagonosporopsis vannaccii]|nr:hypothetical protein SVAN01_04955 [Stagonosporopsis vannaccii]
MSASSNQPGTCATPSTLAESQGESGEVSPTHAMSTSKDQPGARPTPSSLAEFQKECRLAFPEWAPYCAPSCTADSIGATSALAAHNGMLIVPGSSVYCMLGTVAAWLMLWIAVIALSKSVLPTLFVLLPSIAPAFILYLYFDTFASIAHPYFLWVAIVLSAACFLTLFFRWSGILHLLHSLGNALRDYLGGRGWTWRMGYIREGADDDGSWAADVRRIRRRMNNL